MCTCLSYSTPVIGTARSYVEELHQGRTSSWGDLVHGIKKH